MVMYSFINRCIAFKNFFLGTMFRRLVSLVILSTLAFLAYSVKVVPNYATKTGSELVWKSDYEKYQQGYCLAENTILPKEEIYKRGIAQYLRKEIVMNEMLKKPVMQKVGSMFEYHDNKAPKIDYYALDENEITISNWFDVLNAKHDTKNHWTGYRELFMNILHAKPTDPIPYITIDIKSLTAGLTKPFVFYRGQRSYHLILDQSFIFSKDKEAFYPAYMILDEDAPHSISQFKETDADTIFEKKKRYENFINSLKYELRDSSVKSCAKANSALGICFFELDNCGNVQYNIQNILEKTLNSVGNGG